MKTNLLLWIIAIVLLPLLTGCENNDGFDGHLYIVSRNTDSKEGNLVLKYNLSDIKISHIGVAFSTDKNAPVYNVSYGEVNEANSALLKETLTEFWISPNPEDNRFWEFPISKEEYKRAKRYIENQEKKTIYFDFSPDTALGMYCSEFVYTVLKEANSERFKSEPTCEEMKGFERMATNEDYLCYHPADFFLAYKQNSLTTNKRLIED